MAAQLRFADTTVDAGLLDGQRKSLLLKPALQYALCRTGSQRPEGCFPLVVSDPKVSACHFMLSFLDGRWRLADGNGKRPSTNGTLLDGQKVNTLTALTPGCCITAKSSRTALYFELTAGAQKAAEAAATEAAAVAADSASASRCGSAIEAAAEEAAAESAAVEVTGVEVVAGCGGTASQDNCWSFVFCLGCCKINLAHFGI